LKPAWVISSGDPISEKTFTEKGWWSGPRYSYYQKKKKKKQANKTLPYNYCGQINVLFATEPNTKIKFHFIS
jgi:hypothetical protein